jgi:enoyl-CoA hydratase
VSYENIIVETRGKVGLITLNRPKALNALNDKLIDELGAALDAFEADERHRLHRPHRLGKGLCRRRRHRRHVRVEFHGRLQDQLHQPQLGPHRPLPQAADRGRGRLRPRRRLRTGDDVRHDLSPPTPRNSASPKSSWACCPAAGGTQRLPRAVGKAKAMDMCLTSRFMDAAEAERVRPGGAHHPGRQAAGGNHGSRDAIAGFSLPVVMMIKESVNRSYESGLQEGLLFERRTFHSRLRPGRPEGRHEAAFVEKRKPSFRDCYASRGVLHRHAKSVAH